MEQAGTLRFGKQYSKIEVSVLKKHTHLYEYNRCISSYKKQNDPKMHFTIHSQSKVSEFLSGA